MTSLEIDHSVSKGKRQIRNRVELRTADPLVDSERGAVRGKGDVFRDRRRQGETLHNRGETDRGAQVRQTNLFTRRSRAVLQRLGALCSQPVRIRDQGLEQRQGTRDSNCE